MSRLDTAWETWMQIDSVYAKKGKGKDKITFLRSLLSHSALLKLRKAVMSDFVEGEENVSRLNMLFKALERAAEKLGGVTEDPDSIFEFVWGDYEERVDISDFSPFSNDIVFSSERLLQEGYYRNCFTVRDGILAGFACEPDCRSFIHFSGENDVVCWLYRNANRVGKKDWFLTAAYAYVMDSLKNRGEVYPITFIDGDAAKLDGNPGRLDGSAVPKILQGDFQTVTKQKFSCDATAGELKVNGMFGEERVVQFWKGSAV